MEAVTQKDIILRVLSQHGDWLPGWSFVRVKTDYGWLSERASRSLREMSHEGVIEKKYIDGEVWYRKPNGASPLLIELQKLKLEAEQWPVSTQIKML